MGDVKEPSGATTPGKNAIRLESNLNMAAAQPLYDSLNAMRGEDIELQADDVGLLGGQCLAVILAAQKAWHDDGHLFVISTPSSTFRRMATQLGVDTNQFEIAGEAE